MMEFMKTRVNVETVFLHLNTAPNHKVEQFKVTPPGSPARNRSTEATTLVTKVRQIHFNELETDSFFPLSLILT